jgi:phage terminase large subunit
MATDTESLRQSLIRRLQTLDKINRDPQLQAIAWARAAKDPVWWFNTFCWTYDPRGAANGLPAYLPFDLFPRQEELIRWLDDRVAASEEGLVEKSRDVGWTWVAAGFALHKWLFAPGFKTTFGSRKEVYVDRIGDPDSIFGKLRLLLDRLPHWMLPCGFNRSEHDNYLRLINPANGNTITGEAGDNMGRGGRSTCYIVDEGAFIEHADKVDAAIVANANTRIWASSVNGTGNVFYRKRHSGHIPVFRFHWSDDPRKDAAWAEAKQLELSSTPATWAAEYDIDYAASVEGICVPAKWVESSRRLAKALNRQPQGPGVAGLDVGAGRAKSVLIPKFGPVVLMPTFWKTVDNIHVTHAAIDAAQQVGAGQINYDASGVGNTVTSTLVTANTGGVTVTPVNVGIPPTETLMPDGRMATEWFGNLKAQLWWAMRDAFKATHEHLRYLEGYDDGVPHAEDELILLPDCNELVGQISLPKWFRNEGGKIVIESKKQLALRGVPSPDYAEALTLCYAQGDAGFHFSAI